MPATMSEQQRQAERRVLRRDYRQANGQMIHPNGLSIHIHDPDTDSPVFTFPIEASELLAKLCNEAGLTDGDEFEICVTATGKRPQGDRWYIMNEAAPGMVFRPETDDECLKRIQADD